MYFYIFFVVYLANNFSNGLLFRTNPLNEEKELIDLASTTLENFFNNNKQDKNGMTFEEFNHILKQYNWIIEQPELFIRILFREEVGNMDGIMNFKQFKNQATYCINRYENSIEKHFKKYSKGRDNMTLNELPEALKQFNFVYSEEILIILINHFEGEGAQFISMKDR
ncbi:uncharacterized protein LOC126901303 isoform X2 [Daktulosphaira vitifoliae]|uniref:uncharacterized protein LOC126901303 isoform X2 n=1 Tax=Daktulosphaira vitifoliae TaxID=58002 RepID=UPI0021A9C7F3|nr:uncharacterized protein LOC126901303 isoform X2 [Daktulosphaira vitifoliae]